MGKPDPQTTLSDTPSAFDLLAEARWEMEGIRRAQRRYQEAAAVADPSTLPSGQKLLREVVPPLIGRVADLQAEGAAVIGSPSGRVPLWAWPVQMLDAPALAMITVVNCMNAVRDQGGPVSALTAISLEIAAAAQDEIGYRAWVEAQAKVNAEDREAREAAKAAGEAIDWKHRDLLAAFKRQYPAADRKTWTRWRRKIDLLQQDPWDKDTAIQFGAAMIHALVGAAPLRFEFATMNKDIRYLKLSEETVAMMQDIEARAAVARPRLMPMLIPPIPWKYD